jgi:hypothetical protein
MQTAGKLKGMKFVTGQSPVQKKGSFERAKKRAIKL